MPGYKNGIMYKGQEMRNWWEALYDPVGFIEGGNKLYGSSLYNICAPDGKISPTLTLQPTTIMQTPTVTPKPTIANTTPTSVVTPIVSPSLICDPYSEGDSAGKINIQDVILVRDEVLRRVKSNKGSCLTGIVTDPTRITDLIKARRLVSKFE